MKRVYQKGFSAGVVLLCVVLVGLIGGTGFYVYKKANKTSPQVSQPAPNVSNTSPATAEDQEVPTDITFQEKLGISMDILPGWEVVGTTKQFEGATFYNWTVQKPEADGKILLSSTGFQGGFGGCPEAGSVIAVNVKEIMPTKNSNFMFMSWSYDYEGLRNYSAIVRSDGQHFTNTDRGVPEYIQNINLKPGNYFMCLSQPSPGFFLELNDEPATPFTRRDGISAVLVDQTEPGFVGLPTTAKSYADIKTMLTSVK